MERYAWVRFAGRVCPSAAQLFLTLLQRHERCARVVINAHSIGKVAGSSKRVAHNDHRDMNILL